MGFFLLVLFGTILRLVGIARDSLRYDELYTVWSSHLPLASLIKEEAASRHLPAYYLMLHFWLFLGTGRIWIVLISFFSGCASILLVFLVARHLFNEKVAFWAAAMTALSPMMIWYSQDVTYYSWVIFTTLLSFYFLIRVHENSDRKNWLLYFLATTLAIYSYTFSAILVIANIIFLLMITDRKHLQLSFYFTHVLFLVQLGFVLALNVISPPAPGLFKHASISLIKNKLINSIFATRLIMFGGPIESLSQHRRLLINLAMIIILVIVAGGGWRFWTKKQTRALTLFTVILTVSPIFLYSLLADMTDASRFYVWAIPFFLILGAAFIVETLKPATPFLILVIVWLAFFTFPVLKKHDFSNTSWGAAIQVVSENYRQSDAILGFPINGFRVAASFYEPGLQIHGGIIEIGNKTVGLFPPGKTWAGYGYPHLKTDLSGNLLAHAINLQAGSANRMWILSGDGKLFPKPASIDANMPHYWKIIKHWHVPGFFLDLYQRKLTP